MQETAIDISGLGLDQIEETEDAFEIGAMVTPAPAGRTSGTGGMHRRCHARVGAPYRRRAASEPGDSRRQYLWQVWIFRCPDDVPGDGHRSGTLQSWTDAVGGICKTDRILGHFSQINCPKTKLYITISPCGIRRPIFQC